MSIQRLIAFVPTRVSLNLYAKSGCQVGLRSSSSNRIILNLAEYADPDIPILKQAKAEYAKLQ